MQTLNRVQGRIFDNQFEWDKIDKKAALSNTKVLELLREACLIESYFGTYTAKMTTLFWDDVDATSIFTIEAFEAFTHYFILRKYLDIVDYKPITDKEIVTLRKKDINVEYKDPIRELTNFMATELFAAHYFSDLSKLTIEPILKKILTRFASQEETHSDFAFDLLKVRLEANPKIKSRILKHATNYRHIGAYVLPSVSRVEEDNVEIISRLNQKIELLTGDSLSDKLVNAK